MFTNPQTIWIEALVIVAVVLFLGFILGRYIYRKVKHLPQVNVRCAIRAKNNFSKSITSVAVKNNRKRSFIMSGLFFCCNLYA